MRRYFVPAARGFVWAYLEPFLARDRVGVILVVLRAEILADGREAVSFRLCDNRLATIFLSRSSREEEMPYTSAASSIVGYGLASFTGLLIALRIALSLEMRKHCLGFQVG